MHATLRCYTHTVFVWAVSSDTWTKDACTWRKECTHCRKLNIKGLTDIMVVHREGLNELLILGFCYDWQAEAALVALRQAGDCALRSESGRLKVRCKDSTRSRYSPVIVVMVGTWLDAHGGNTIIVIRFY